MSFLWGLTDILEPQLKYCVWLVPKFRDVLPYQLYVHSRSLT